MGVSGYGGRKEGRAGRIAVSGRSLANIFLSLVRVFVPALVLIAIAPTVAFAAQYGDVVYGPAATGITSGEYYVQVYAFNKYEAAAAALGNNVRDTSIFTDDVKAKLSNESTGGDFYDFAQKFTDDEFGGGFNPITSSAADLSMQSAYKLNVDMYGSNSVFWAKFTESEAGAASAALARVAAGESGGGESGGGGSGGVVDDGEYITFVKDSRTAGTEIPDVTSVRFLKSQISTNESFFESVTSGYMYLRDRNVNNGTINVNVFFFATGGYSITPDGDRMRFDIDADTDYQSIMGQGSNSIAYGASYSLDGGVMTVTLRGSAGLRSWSHTNSKLTIVYNTQARWTGVLGSSDDSGPTVPPTNWPDDGEPVAPSPPELPDPSPPETPNPPQDPTPSPNPTYNVEIDYPDFTYVTADLSAILEAMNSHCEHLRHALYDNLTEFWRLLSTKLTNDFATLRTFLANQFSWQTSAIEGYIDDLSDYLYDLFHWLADQFDFTFGSGDGGYDDTSLLYWLKRIYYKLGTGTTIKPVDPVVEPDAWWLWLEQLFNNFVMDLLALGANGLADVMDGLRTLITKFPFSMPWDIAAILGLLVSEPVTPSVTWPIYSVSSGFQLSQVGTMTIDLDDYSDVWEGVRNMERIGFAVFLAWNITKFTDMMPSKEKTI